MAADGRVSSGVAGRLMRLLHGEDVFAGFAPALAADLQGWNGTHPALARVVGEAKPRIVLDVGVWKGQSTATLCRAMREAGITDGAVVAIDTFLGSPEHWNRERPDRIHESLRMLHGWPGLYWQFLCNMVAEGVGDMVVPLPQTSENAALILKQRGIAPDLVHIDAAHEYKPVLRDIKLYWELLRPGGVLIGDDWAWPGVAKAATEFAAKRRLKLEVDAPKWVLRKPV